MERLDTVNFRLLPLIPIGSPPTMSQAVAWIYKRETMRAETFDFTLMMERELVSESWI
jgi:hypothetical protein